jgi:trehalose synthase
MVRDLIEEVPIEPKYRLPDYEAHTALRPLAQRLVEVAERGAASIDDRTIWMVNSTAHGGGVAEMLPGLIGLLRDLGFRVRWLTIQPREEAFFGLTKRLHNLIHGSPVEAPTSEDFALYKRVSESLAEALTHWICSDDFLVVHDPQPAGCGAILKQRINMRAVWRCHIGLEEETPATRAAWDFLMPWVSEYDRSVFSVRDYVPEPLLGKSTIIPPAIDPLSHKNRRLPIHKLTGILTNGRLGVSQQPVLYPEYEHPALRLQSDGSFAPATAPEDLGILFRPTVTQVSRWDRLKGWDVLLRAFIQLKSHDAGSDERQRMRLAMTRLVLAGPDPRFIQDDPEGQEVFEELVSMWRELSPELQRDVALILLPMDDPVRNHLMVNVLQCCSSVVVQASRREGFGLTVTEAMWKGSSVLATSVGGIKSQIRDGVDGRLTQDPEDPAELCQVLVEMLSTPAGRNALGLNAQRKVADQYLVLSQAARWIDTLAELG